MKRMLVIVALAVLLFSSIGVTIVTAKQAGNSPIYTFDVTAKDSAGSGTLIIDTAKHTFVFNGHGFEAGKTLYLQYATSPTTTCTFALVVATKGGTVHHVGIWLPEGTPTGRTYTVSTTTPLYPVLHCYWYQEEFYNGEWSTPCCFEAMDSTGAIAQYQCSVTVGIGEGVTSITVYTGPNANLNLDSRAPYSDKAYIPADAVYARGNLGVYDSLGNSAYTQLVLFDYT